MMYLSTLLVNTGDRNADRPRPGRLWLRNIYHVHQRLSMAFRSRKLKELITATDEPKFRLFLQPYEPEQFEQPYFLQDEKRPRFLFRIDHEVQRTVILVLSENQPDWDYAFQNAPGLVKAHQCRKLAHEYSTGERLHFRILINLTKKDKETRKEDMKGRTDNYGRIKSQSKRVGIRWGIGENPVPAIKEWFAKKAEHNGFCVNENEYAIHRIGWVSGNKKPQLKNEPDQQRDWHKIQVKVALIDGILAVSDIDLFGKALQNGIGSGKAFGCGLLTVLPLN